MRRSRQKQFMHLCGLFHMTQAIRRSVGPSMECMPGKPAGKKLANATPEQDSHFLRQMAKIQVKLANVRMDRIGSIFQSSDGFEVGPDVETAQGPFEKPLPSGGIAS